MSQLSPEMIDRHIEEHFPNAIDTHFGRQFRISPGQWVCRESLNLRYAPGIINRLPIKQVPNNFIINTLYVRAGIVQVINYPTGVNQLPGEVCHDSRFRYVWNGD